MKRFITLALTLAVLAASVPALAGSRPKDKWADKGHWSLSTNLAEWAYFGTMNIGGSYAVAQHAVLHADVRWNPWTFNSARLTETLTQQQLSAGAGFRWYFWYNYSGWWAGGKVLYEKYNMGRFMHDWTEQGDAFGLAAGGGYSLMIYRNLNLDLGLYAWGGTSAYTRFSGQYEGKVLESGTKWFFLPETVLISLVYVF